MSVPDSVRPPDSPSGSVRPFSALFSYMFWHIELQFCIWHCFTVIQIKCRQFASIFVGVMSLLELTSRIQEIHSFRTFLLHALTYWPEIFYMTFIYWTLDKVWMSSIFVVFLPVLCPFWNLEYWKYTVFQTFLLHALTYWPDILYMTLIS